MLRRRSEFFLFLDDSRSKKSGKEEHKEERHPSPCDDYLEVLLQMKGTSDVSEQIGFPQESRGNLRSLELNLYDLYMLEFFMKSMTE